MGICLGDAELDDCGICDGIEEYVAESCYDCGGIPNGDSYEDNCDVCRCGETVEGDCSEEDDCVQDCFDEWGGSAVEDECGVCGGENTSCSGCTDPDALNYDPDAIVDNGECDLSIEGKNKIQLPNRFSLSQNHPNPFVVLTPTQILS